MGEDRIKTKKDLSIYKHTLMRTYTYGRERKAEETRNLPCYSSTVTKNFQGRSERQPKSNKNDFVKTLSTTFVDHETCKDRSQ